MNRRQKIVQGRFLDNEEAVIGMLEDTYSQSLQDVTKKSQKLYDEIETLTAELDFIEDEAEREVQKSRIRSKVYQKQYQDGLKKQVSDVLDKMHEQNFKTVSDYLQTCYEDGFVGTLYDLQGQGLPLAFPIDQEAVTRAVQIDSKISNGLYSHLGEDVASLKKHIASEVSRGISSGMTFNQIAQQLSFKMSGTYNNSGGSLAYAKRIARTEGHRIQCQAGMDACNKAKDMGADVVKQWDSTLDAKTRESHAMVDQEIKEIDEKFSNGLMFPGDPSGGAAEVVNCRCALLQRARWAVKGGFTKMNNFTKQLETFESPEEYGDFKKAFFSKENRNYMNYTEQMREKYGTKDFQKLLEKMDEREYKHFMKLQEGNPLFNKKADSTPSFDITEGGKYEQLKVRDKNKYSKIIEHEFATQKASVKELRHLWDKDVGYIQNSQGYQDINGFLRGLKPALDNPKRRLTINIMDRLTSNNELTKNYVGSRKVDSGYLLNVLGIDASDVLKTSLQRNVFGKKIPVQIPKNKAAAQIIADKINGLIGTDKGTIPDDAFTSISLSEDLNYFTHFPFKFEIQMPEGTKGFITDNLPESEFITKRGSSLDILGAEVYNDGAKDCVKIFARLLQ
jgi:hypothetical protein